jgi:hypothetical protein
LRLVRRRFDHRSKDGSDARIYTIVIEMSNLFGAVRRVFGGRSVEHTGRASGANAGEQRRIALQPDDHDLGGFHKGRDGLAFF